jgi:dTDP-glucose pyrophosphorylase
VGRLARCGTHESLQSASFVHAVQTPGRIDPGEIAYRMGYITAKQLAALAAAMAGNSYAYYLQRLAHEEM